MDVEILGAERSDSPGFDSGHALELGFFLWNRRCLPLGWASFSDNKLKGKFCSCSNIPRQMAKTKPLKYKKPKYIVHRSDYTIWWADAGLKVLSINKRYQAIGEFLAVSLQLMVDLLNICIIPLLCIQTVIEKRRIEMSKKTEKIYHQCRAGIRVSAPSFQLQTHQREKRDLELQSATADSFTPI